MPIPSTFTSEQVRTEFGLTLPMTSEQVRTKAGLTVPWTSAQLVGKSGVTVSVTGYIRDGFVNSDGWTEYYANWGEASVAVTGGTPTAYLWTMSGDTGQLFFGGATNGRTATITSGWWEYGNGQLRQVVLSCRVTVGGVNYTGSVTLDYYG